MTYDSLSLPINSNTTITKSLETPHIIEAIYLRFDFEFSQTEALYRSLIQSTQNFIRTQTTANIVVFDQNSMSIKGYYINSDKSCSERLVIGNG